MMTTRSRYDRILSRLPDTIDWSNRQDISEGKVFLADRDTLPRIFLGSGGSLSAAQLAMQLSVERGIVAVAMTPYQYIFSAWSKIPAKVVLISAGGRNVDAINAYATAHGNPGQEVGALLMTTQSHLQNIMMKDGEDKVFAYSLKNRDGFLATNSLVAFYSILFRIYRDEKPEIKDWSFTQSIAEELKTFIGNTYELPTENWDEHTAAMYEARETDRFYVLYSPDTMPIAIDLESRFSEGSVGCLQISDYRNFAHGRFNWFHQRKGQTAIIALISPESETIAEGILAQLPDDIPIMRLSTQIPGTNGTMELLLKGMYLSKYLGLRWGLDIGAPKVADFGKVIHKMDFMGHTTVPKSESSQNQTSHEISASILSLPIANISRVNDHIIRGETLWASRNRRYLQEVKDAGIEVIIDFRTADFTEKFSELCGRIGLEYRHYPIDKANQSDDELWRVLPEMFDLLDNRNCYISCQQGLHRTDIALAIYFMFHCPETVPKLIGHIKKGTLRCDDVMRRINSLYKALTQETAEKAGLPQISETEFQLRRKMLLNGNRQS